MAIWRGGGRMSPVPRRSGARPLVAGHAPKQRLSQSFLVDLEARDAIVVAGGAAPGEIVLEIGPGLGVLTEGLLAAGARVIVASTRPLGHSAHVQLPVSDISLSRTPAGEGAVASARRHLHCAVCCVGSLLGRV